MESKCKACDRRREGLSEFCVHHGQAFANLREAFEGWRRALGIDWEGFLTEVSKNSETGEWAREVAEYLLSDGSTEYPA